MALRTRTASTRNQQTLSAALVLVATCLTLVLSSNASAQIVSGQKTVQVSGLSLLRFDQVEKFDSLRATAAIAIANLKAASEAATQNQAPSWNANEMRNLINNALASIGDFETRQEVRNTIEAPKAQDEEIANAAIVLAPAANATPKTALPAQSEWVHVPEPSSDGLAIAMLIILAALVAKSRRNA